MENPFEKQIQKKKYFRVGVHSGKGGVGKTFVSVNLAFSLLKSGFKVGLLDGDIDCPNVSKFLAINSVAKRDGSSVQPIISNGMEIVSTALLNPFSESPIIIRGPIKHNMLLTFLNLTKWGELDYLVIDLPPGTADVPLSAMQLSALDGLILVSAPTKESLLDTARAINMAKKLNVPILGLVENMSGEIFGSKGEEFAKRMEIPYLGTIPLSKETAAFNEEGKIAFLEQDSLFKIRDNLIKIIKEKKKST